MKTFQSNAEAENEGFKAYWEHCPKIQNPYSIASNEGLSWFIGWEKAEYSDNNNIDTPNKRLDGVI